MMARDDLSRLVYAVMNKTFLALACAALAACAPSDPTSSEAPSSPSNAGTTQPTSKPMSAPTVARLDAARYEHFGAGVAVGAQLAPAIVVGDTAKYEGQTVRVAGPVGSVCRSAGCWLTVGEAGASEIFVDTKHVFTVPTDCIGREAVVEGVFAIREKGGKSEPAIIATGVALSKPQPPK